MRMLLGIIIGVLLTVGGTYVHDLTIEPADSATRGIVNWNVADRTLHELATSTRESWVRLTQR